QTALERSLNSATARVARDVGIRHVRDIAYRLGIQSPLPVFPSLALGSAEVTPPQLAFMMNYMMKGVLDRGTARAARQLGFTRPAAGKTGTTNDTKDAWFAGYTPDLLAVVW